MMNMSYILLVMLPGLALAGAASWFTKRTFTKYAKYVAASRLTGAQAARQMLDTNGLQDVKVERVQGFLSDHYNPMTRTLRLSPAVYDQPSLSAIGVACHEAGHAMQHANHYFPLHLRSALVPITNIGSSAAYWVIAAGAIMQSQSLIGLGLICFALAVLFAFVTLPVEWDASARAKRVMVSSRIVTPQESVHAGTVLNAAFLTYVAAAVSALLQFLYFFLRYTGGSRD